MRGSVIRNVGTAHKTRTPLLVAYHLAKGSQETASDIAAVLDRSTPSMSEEFAHLAANFQRICELLKEAGVKP